MEDNLDYRSELDNWISMWNSDEQGDIHPDSEPVKTFPYQDGSDYNDIFYDYMQDGQDEEPELIQEDHKIPNPVYPDSVGPDHTTTPPVWVNEEKLMKEIQALKDKMFDLENQIAQLGGSEDWQEKALVRKTPTEISKKMEDLKEKIERTSSQLGIEDEPSPWVVKER